MQKFWQYSTVMPVLFAVEALLRAREPVVSLAQPA
jgi:hypothetical protein